MTTQYQNADDYNNIINEIVNDLSWRISNGEFVTDNQLYDIISDVNILICRMASPDPELTTPFVFSGQYKDEISQNEYNLKIRKTIEQFNWRLFAEEGADKDLIWNMTNTIISYINNLIWKMARPELPIMMCPEYCGQEEEAARRQEQQPLEMIDLTGDDELDMN
jgi:hypothetical protein